MQKEEILMPKQYYQGETFENPDPAFVLRDGEFLHRETIR